MRLRELREEVEELLLTCPPASPAAEALRAQLALINAELRGRAAA